MGAAWRVDAAPVVLRREEVGGRAYVELDVPVRGIVPIGYHDLHVSYRGREGTTFLLHHCTAAGEPLQTRSVTTKELADAPEADRLLLVTLDGSGWATGGETFAGC